MVVHLRRIDPDDVGGLRSVCLRTAAAGGDATDLVGDPDLPGDVFAVPYAEFAPDTSLVLDDGTGSVVGYVVAAADTAAFEARCETDWWPHLRERYPMGSGTRPLDEVFIGMIHDPPTTAPAVLVDHPSHLHINLLPIVHGGGWGRTMLTAIADVLLAQGSHGIHLGVDVSNHGAQRFYERVGFRRLETTDDEVLYGMRLTSR